MSKKKTAPAPHEQPAHLEDTLTDVTDSVANALKKYQIPIIVGVVVVIGILGLSAVATWYKDASARNQAQEIFSVFAYSALDERASTDTRSDEEITLAVTKRIETAADELAPRLVGSDIEPKFVSDYAFWLWQVEREPGTARQAKQKKAVSLLQAAVSRHADNAQLKQMSDNFARVALLDSSFTVPAPPEPIIAPGVQIQSGANIVPSPTTANPPAATSQPKVKLTPVPAPTIVQPTSQPANGGN